MGIYNEQHDSGRSDRPEPGLDGEQEQENRTCVEVIADFSADGRLRPLRIIWEDGRAYAVEKILRADRCASLKTGGAGIRYVCSIRGQRVVLYYEGNGCWTVNRKTPSRQAGP